MAVTTSTKVFNTLFDKIKTIKYDGINTCLESNVFAGETAGKETFPVKYFPRLELQIHVDDSKNYVSQGYLSNLKMYSLSGWLMFDTNTQYRDNSAIALERMNMLLTFFDNATQTIFSLNDDKNGGTLDLEWFEQVHPETKCDLYHETYDKVSSFVILFGLQILKDWRII